MKTMLTSVQNPRIKNLQALDKARERKKQQLFIIEGVKELSLAKEAGYEIESIFYCEALITESDLLTSGFWKDKLVAVSRSVFEKIAYRETSGGIIAVARQRRNKLSDIQLPKNPLLLILESVEKPGNLGAILRTADAAGVDAVISCDPQTDFYNPNVVRSSLGSVFTNQIATAGSAETIKWLQAKGIKLYCTYLGGGVNYTEVSYRQPCAIVMGSEANGLTEEWIKNSDANIIIPMRGKVDSMNVSVSAAVVVFEAIRQRA